MGRNSCRLPPRIEAEPVVESELPEIVAEVSPPSTSEMPPANIEMIPPPIVVATASTDSGSPTTAAVTDKPKPHKVHLDPIPVNWKPNPKLDPRKH